MRAAVIVFPGSNCDRDLAVAIAQASGQAPLMVWHQETDFPAVDLIGLPGGFSYGDYLRSGAMAARSAVMREVVRRADAGVAVLAVCNGFQVATESGLLPGALMRNAGLKFVCRDVTLRVERTDTPFTAGYVAGQDIRIPVAHHDGNYFADAETLARVRGEGQVVFRYRDNPNGSLDDIAGIVNARGNVLGMMPHPERLAEAAHGGTDGRAMFDSLVQRLAA